MATWPASLPQEQFLGLTEQRQDARLRSSMDAGPPKMRRLFTAVSRTFSIPIIMTGAQRQTFDDFYKETLLEGSLPFDWEDPVTDVTVSFTFGTSPPQFQMILGGTDTSRLWKGTLDLEVLP